MKKMLFFAAIALTALGSCTSDEFVGENQSSTSQDSGAIAFTSGTKNITRATGADAAALLHNNFVVEGIKTIPGSGSSPTTVEVFDNYNVNYSENTADKTASNTANWEYVNQPILSGKTAVSEQTIKYWDFAASQYDFWAYSLGTAAASDVTVTSLDHDAALGTSAYTITGSLENLGKVYISDLQTAYNPEKSVSGLTESQTAPLVMGNEVDLTFRSLVTKVRMGLYETIPGYSVRDVQFYPSASGTPASDVYLYASSAALPAVGSGGTATYKVSFDHIGKDNLSSTDYNKAHVALDGESNGTSANIGFGTLAYGAHQDGKHEKTGYTEGSGGSSDTWTEIWVQRAANQATWATESGASAGAYSIVLPNETGAVLTLKVDYTLESIDGSGETITVHGATTLVPSQYTQWKPNYAYTYLFKISDNTNGLTNTLVTDKPGLYPITLDAVVTGAEDGTQETITTVATPSITTYSVTSDVTHNNEYTTGDDIYVTATTDGTLLNLNNYGATLYTVSKTTATEAEVLDALTKYSSLTDGTGTYVGRNEITLVPVTGGLDLTKTEIPLVDGNKITGLTAGQVALIDKSKLSAGTYAFVYKVTNAGASPTAKYEAVTLEAGNDATNYFTTNTGEDAAATTNPSEAQTVYAKYFVVNNVTYAIKVIKIVAASSGEGGSGSGS